MATTLKTRIPDGRAVQGLTETVVRVGGEAVTATKTAIAETFDGRAVYGWHVQFGGRWLTIPVQPNRDDYSYTHGGRLYRELCEALWATAARRDVCVRCIAQEE